MLLFLGMHSGVRNITMGTYHPCLRKKNDISPDIKACCELLEDSLKGIDTQDIMMIMKYSLYMTDPLISKYLGRNNNLTKSFNMERNLLHFWRAKMEERWENFETFQGWRYITNDYSIHMKLS